MAKSGFSFDASKVVAKLTHLANRIPAEVGSALHTEAEIEKTESMRRTPVDTDTLRSSHIVTGPTGIGKDISVKIEVGQGAESYAWKVHEDTEALHKTGQALFLSSTLDEFRPHMVDRIARRLDLRKLL